jgi:DNA invertase Pin-like site-specific DNA recombinase
MIYGYMRISTQKGSQTTQRQRVLLEQYARDNDFTYDQILEERISGTVKADNRPVYSDLKEKTLRKDDILIVTDLDRLGRNADDTISELKDLKYKGIRVIALDIPYMNDFKNAANDSLYHMVTDILITLKAHIAQQEREKTVERITAGLEAARQRGQKLGRPAAILPDSFVKEYPKWKAGKYGDMSATAFAKMIGIGRSTLYKYIKLFDEN